MFYYPTKPEIYSSKLKNYLMSQNPKKPDFDKKLAKIKLYEAIAAKPFLEPTDGKRFISESFLKIEAASGKRRCFLLGGDGKYLIDRRLIYYLLLELCSGGRVEAVLHKNGMAIKTDAVGKNSVAAICKKLKAMCLYLPAGERIIGIPLKRVNCACDKTENMFISLSNKYSPEYLWTKI